MTLSYFLLYVCNNIYQIMFMQLNMFEYQMVNQKNKKNEDIEA